jgi:hypothetical protein
MEQTEAPEEPQQQSYSAPVPNPPSTADNRFNHGGQSRAAQRNEPCSQQVHILDPQLGMVEAEVPRHGMWINRPLEMGRYYTLDWMGYWNNQGLPYAEIHPNRGH